MIKEEGNSMKTKVKCIVPTVMMIILISYASYEFHVVDSHTKNPEVVINSTPEPIKDPDTDIDVYIGYLVDAPKKNLANSKYGYSYRSILDNYYDDSEWTYLNNSDDTKIDVTVQFDGHDDTGTFKVTFRFIHNNNEEFSKQEIHAYLNGSEEEGSKHLDRLIR